MKTNSDYAADPRCAGLVGKERRAMIDILHKEYVATLPIVKKAKLPTMREIAAAQRAYDNSFHTITIVRETEKAVEVAARIDFCDLEKDQAATAWIPKSLLNPTGQAPGWFLIKKINEMHAAASARNSGSVIVEFV